VGSVSLRSVNFKKYAPECPVEVRGAGPKLQGYDFLKM
jgi:hypothetical protein